MTIASFWFLAAVVNGWGPLDLSITEDYKTQSDCQAHVEERLDHYRRTVLNTEGWILIRPGDLLEYRCQEFKGESPRYQFHLFAMPE